MRVREAEHREMTAVQARIVGSAEVAERVVTRAGRVSVTPTRLVQEMGTAAMGIEPQELCPAEVSFLAALTDMANQGEEGLNNEIACVSAGLGSAGMSGKFRARINARGYEQVDGIHYDSDSTAAPVVNEITIRMVFVLMVMAGWYAEVVDVCGAILHGKFHEGT